MSISLSSSTALAIVILVYVYVFVSRRNSSKLPLPPGPRKLPLVGNWFDIPPAFEWEAYLKWSKKYDSDIIHLSVAGRSMVVLSSLESTVALLEKKASIYSDRNISTMVVDLMGWDFNFGYMSRRDHRRLFKQEFNPKGVERHRSTEFSATHALLRRIVENPESFLDHARQFAGEIIMRIAYGLEIRPSNDSYVALAKQAIHSFSVAHIPGRFLVDSIPILKYVPSWLPGAEFKRKARRWRVLARAIADTPFAEAKQNMVNFISLTGGLVTIFFNRHGVLTRPHLPRSLCAINDSENKEYQEKVVWATAATMYIGGAETTSSALSTFFLAMLSNPEAQTKAQLEIDSVTKGRLPNFDDLTCLPYVDALVKEVLRWKSVAPIASPRLLTVEDEYRGYRLPAGSIIIVNTWAILHDETTYPDPHSFKPERFLLDNGQPNPAVPSPNAAFGFSRRQCAGRHLANSSLLIAIVSLLATFDIKKAVGEDGREIEPSYEYLSGFLSGPLPFKAKILPRSPHAMALIDATKQKGPQA
ncbi:cytochrome P450 [Mycena epipterygia]|nr:cytochrome P450 [Mycena epipterygia]